MTCPRRFWFAYVRKLRVASHCTPQLLLGQAIHVALASLYQLPVAQRDPATAHRLLRAAWKRQPRAEVFLSPEEEAGWGQRALALLSDYCATWDLRVRPLAVEEWITAVIADRAEVFGKADRVDSARAADGIEIVDYKTGRLHIGNDTVHEQLAARLYALAAWRTYGRPVHRVRFLWLAERHEAVWFPELEDLAAAQTEFTELSAQIAADREWEPRPGPGCRFCLFAPHCEARETDLLGVGEQ